MSRSSWLVLALAALGLWASLVPQITYKSASTGDPSSQVLIAWPGWGVQQDLGSLSGTVGRFQIWIAATSGSDVVTVHASLVDASTREVIRETTIDVEPAYIPVPRKLTFPAYNALRGQRLLLQLQVAEFERVSVVYRLASPRPGLANVMLNGTPDAGHGPLAYVHEWTGSGLRAALRGEQSERIRFGLACGFSGLAVLGWLRVGSAVRRRFSELGLARGPDLLNHAENASTRRARVLARPWYPWMAASIPVFHFLANNQLHFTISDAAVALGVTLSCITVGVIGVWLRLRDWHRSSAVVTAVAVVVFAYGHVENLLGGHIDERAFFAGAVVLAAVLSILASDTRISRATIFLNVTSSILLFFSVVSLASGATVTAARSTTDDPMMLDRLTDHLPPLNLDQEHSYKPDIYHIVLDAYSRNDSLKNFDNKEFLSALERRGFYVAGEAISNYATTIPSIVSTLNMGYVHDVMRRNLGQGSDVIISHGEYSALVAILKALGYAYVHLESGTETTNEAPLADIFVEFTPSGVLTCSNSIDIENSVCGSSREGLSGIRFSRELAQTTAFKPVAGRFLQRGDTEPYEYWSPRRTLDMFEFLAAPLDLGVPKYTMAHIVKPHDPATFDRHGNYISGSSREDAFRDDHDLSLPDAYTGQLVYINKLTIDMIDSVLEGYPQNLPIIVITADHGRPSGDGSNYSVLSAFHLPRGGNSELYPAISLVNHFRLILDYYFGLGLGLVEDRKL